MEITAKFIYELYKNQETGWSCLSLHGKDGRFKATGVVPFDLVKNKEYIFTGNFVVKAKYGETFEFVGIEDVSDNSVTGIADFLSSKVKGIGPSTAKIIIDTFGEDTFKIFDDNPKKLLEIKGITENKLTKILESYNANVKFKKIYTWLLPYGITPGQIKKIGDKYGNKTVDVLKTNPYQIYEDINGIGFLTADGIALKLGMKQDSPERIRAGILYCLEEGNAEGHVYLTTRMLKIRLGKLIAKNNIAELDDIINDLIKDGFIVKVDDKIYNQRLYNDETAIAYHIRRLKRCKSAFVYDVNESLTDVENEIRKTNFYFKHFDDIQKEAIVNAAAENVSIITGGPGTGKTSVIIGVIKALQMKNKNINIVQCAPTGKAAKRMVQQTGLPSSTIHRLLIEQKRKTSDEERVVFTGDVFVLDESSMVDTSLMAEFLRGIPDGAKVIFIGDTDQLPSIGPGAVLADMIASNKIKKVYLDTIYRQEGESGIVQTSQMVKRGLNSLVFDRSMEFIDADGDEACFETLMNKYQELLSSYSFEDIQILTPFRKNRKISANSINEIISERFNSNTESITLGGKRFKLGDRVVHIKNDYNLGFYARDLNGNIPDPWQEPFEYGVFNGDIGTVVKVGGTQSFFGGGSDDTILVRFDDDKYVYYDVENIHELELSFATTVHKSQGAEYPIVLIPVLKSQSFFLERNLIYTAITRASKLCILIGEKQAYAASVKSRRSKERKTSLKEQI